MSNLRKEALELYNRGETNITQIARDLVDKHDLPLNIEYYRKNFSKFINKNKDFAGPIAESKSLGIDFDKVSHGWIKGKNASYFFRNEGETVDLEEIKEDFKQTLDKYAPKYPKLDRSKQRGSDGVMVVISLADLHIGRFCDMEGSNMEADIEKGVKAAHEAIDGMLDMLQGHNISKFWYILGNDLMHTSRGKATTKNTPQDIDQNWYNQFRAAHSLTVAILEKLLTVADVHVSTNLGNHDYHETFYAGVATRSHFRHAEENGNITWDDTPQSRKYVKFGNSIVGSTHGDKARGTKLGELLQYETQKWAADAKFRYVLCHHLHSKHATSTVGVSIEHLMSITRSDQYHNDMGYISDACFETFVFSKKFGQVARYKYNFLLEDGKDGTISSEILDRNVLG